MNWLLDIDSYKASHFQQYPPNMTSMFSYLEARGGKFSYTVFFGLQYLLKEYLTQRVSMDQVIEANKLFKAHGLPFNYDGWRHIAVNCNGYLPVKIKAVQEGSVVPTGNVLLTVESTDPCVPWIVSWIETILVRLWYPCTVATVSREAKKVIYDFLDESSDNPSAEIPFKLHDFGSRGVSSQESAAIGGAAHLVNFKGTDTIASLSFLNKYYREKMAGFSIPASEHSTITSWSRDYEHLAYKNIIEKYKDYPFYACVADSYDLENAIKTFGKYQDLMSKGTLVVRPDSGDPVRTVLNTVVKLDKEFGHSVNSKGYKLLNKVRVIQGDGIGLEVIEKILRDLDVNNWSASNISFGMGGGLLQKVDRDTLSFAYKCSSVTINGSDRDVFKEAPGKKSKKGKLGLIKDAKGQFKTVENPSQDNILQTVFLDGRILKETTLSCIRSYAEIPFKTWVDDHIEKSL